MFNRSDIRSGPNQFLEHLFALGGGAEREDDFGAAK